MEPINPTDADLLGTGAKYQVDETQSTRLRYQSLPKNKGNTSSKVQPDTEPLQLQNFSNIQAYLLSKDELDKESDKEEVLAAKEDMNEDPLVTEEHEEAAISYDNLKASIEHYYDENIAHRYQTDKLVEASMSDLYKGLDVIIQLLKDITNVVKDDPATSKKIEEATKTFANISSQTTKILSLVKDFDFTTLQSTMKNLQDHALKQEEASAAWTKSSTNMAWNLGLRMTAIEIS
ncbi:hypothetical protein Tco_1085458 [Tanacetum coccineum]